ncbi:MAG: adhesin/invasin [Frankiales bacterium]|nr:adhesin/invasin [Frankiales bacterium]
MSRRRIATALAASLVGAGIVPLVMSMASATPTCPAWTDPSGDAELGVDLLVAAQKDPSKATADDDLDILGTAIGADSQKIYAKLRMKQLGDTSKNEFSDSFKVDFTVAGKEMYFYVSRDPAESPLFTEAYFTGPLQADPLYDATVTIDKASSTISFEAAVADAKKLAGKEVAGQPVSLMYSGSATATSLAQGYHDDSAPAPAPSYSFGTACSLALPSASVPSASASAAPSATASATPSATPSATATASATPSATESATPPPATGDEAPFALPRVGCALFTDGKGDATPTIAGPAQDPNGNEADLDITAFAMKTTADTLRAVVKVDKLGDTTAGFSFGDKFTVEFKSGAKTVDYYAGRKDSSLFGLAPNPTADQIADPNGSSLDGKAEPKLKFKPTFDKTANAVIFDIDRAALEGVLGAALAAGDKLTAVSVKTQALEPGQTLAADSATGATADAATYVVGDNSCFRPPAAKMEWLGDDVVTAQYGDLIEAAVQLVADDDSPLDGRTVTFTLGGATVSTVTDADGVADAFLPATAVGKSSVLASFAGDADNYMTSLPYDVTVKPETSKLKITVVKSGTKRTVTAALTDDDTPVAKPLAGQRLDVLVNGKKVGTVTTDAKGKATWAKAVAGQTIKFSFAAVTGKYAGTTAQLKLA